MSTQGAILPVLHSYKVGLFRISPSFKVFWRQINIKL